MATPLLAAGFGLQAGASLLEGFMGSRQKKNEAAIAKYNAEVARQNAEAVRKRTKFMQSRQAERAAIIQKELEAEIGGTGLVSTEGAPKVALAIQKGELELENFLIGMEGRIEAEQLESQAVQFDMAKRMAKRGAKQSLIGGFLGAGSSAIFAMSEWPRKQSIPGDTKGAYSYGYGQSWRARLYGK